MHRPQRMQFSLTELRYIIADNVERKRATEKTKKIAIYVYYVLCTTINSIININAA